jgi:transposase
MRKSSNGLSEIARQRIEVDPASGAALLFTNQRRNLIKIFYFDGIGYFLVAKRLRKETFSLQKDIEDDRTKSTTRLTAPASVILKL